MSLSQKAHTSFTVINAFTNWLISMVFYGVDVTKHHIIAPVSVDTKLTTTTVEDIGRCTAAVVVAVLKGDKSVVDQSVKLASDTLIYGELRKLLEEHTGHPFTIEERSIKQYETVRDEAVKAGDWGTAVGAAYGIVIGTGIGVWRPKAESWNAQHQIPTTTLKEWLKDNLKTSEQR